MRFTAAIVSIMVATATVPQADAQRALILGGMGDGEAVPNADDAVWSSPRKPVSLEVQTVSFDRNLPAGAILIQTRQRKLFFVLPGGKALQYPVGVGREGFAWSGQNIISRKAEWPDWRPPREMIIREAHRGRRLPELMKGGPQNPLGARALYIGDTQFRIHGTTQPWSIGKAMSSGCIRMLNEHVIQLYREVQLGAQVVVE